jgi:PmbA protein
MDDLIAAAQRACEAAIAAGAEFADASAHRGTSLSVSLEDGAIKSSDARDSCGVSVRAYYRGGLGWYHCDGIAAKAAAEAGAAASALARQADPDPDFKSLPQPAAYEQVEGLFDDAVAGLTIRQLIQYSVANIEAALSVEPDGIVAGGSSAGSSESALANSLGVVAAGRSSSVSCYSRVALRRGDEVGMFYDFDYARRLEEFDPEGLGARAAQEAAKFLGARDIETKDLPVVFGPLASGGLLLPLAFSADAESVQRKRSFMVGKLGQQVASEIVTLVDDPFIPGGMASRGFDGEGTARTRLTLIEKGVLQTYLHDSYTAGKAGVQSTGHSTRGGISPTNVNPELGDKTADEIIREVDEGLYMNSGGVQPNSVTGDFSSSIDFAFKIENGELAYPVKKGAMGGNIIELLKSVDAISSDYRAEPGSVMPTVRVRVARIAGGA